MSDQQWAVHWDGGNMEDLYDERPSEFIIRQTQRACPDEPVRVYEITDDGYKLLEHRLALKAMSL